LVTIGTVLKFKAPKAAKLGGTSRYYPLKKNIFTSSISQHSSQVLQNISLQLVP
jgi:hypothetical protein